MELNALNNPVLVTTKKPPTNIREYSFIQADMTKSRSRLYGQLTLAPKTISSISPVDFFLPACLSFMLSFLLSFFLF
jgi:hypothetical protein